MNLKKVSYTNYQSELIRKLYLHNKFRASGKSFFEALDMHVPTKKNRKTLGVKQKLNLHKALYSMTLKRSQLKDKA